MSNDKCYSCPEEFLLGNGDAYGMMKGRKFCPKCFARMFRSDAEISTSSSTLGSKIGELTFKTDDAELAGFCGELREILRELMKRTDDLEVAKKAHATEILNLQRIPKAPANVVNVESLTDSKAERDYIGSEFVEDVEKTPNVLFKDSGWVVVKHDASPDDIADAFRYNVDSKRLKKLQGKLTEAEKTVASLQEQSNNQLETIADLNDTIKRKSEVIECQHDRLDKFTGRLQKIQQLSEGY